MVVSDTDTGLSVAAIRGDPYGSLWRFEFGHFLLRRGAHLAREFAGDAQRNRLNLNAH
jgi:hypothetical protein